MPSPNGHGPKRAILYARVSTDEQARSGYSLAQQIEALRQYANREGYEVLEEVTDPGQSGVSLQRPGMDRVRDLVAAGGVSVMLAQDRDRFAREPAYLYLLKQEFGEYGAKIRALNDRGDDSPEGELMDGVFDQFAKFERAKTAERSRRGKLRKAREGKIIVTDRPNYGFHYNEAGDAYVVDEKRMTTVRRIFRMIGTEGVLIHSVKKVLEREGIPAPRGGQYWDKKLIREIILNDVYKPHTYDEMRELTSPEVAAQLDTQKRYGIWWFNRRRATRKLVAEYGLDGRSYRRRYKSVLKPREEWIAVPVPDAGIPRELVDAAREAIKDNRRPSAAGTRFWELSGGVLVCGGCGCRMMAHRRRKSPKSPYYHYYRCPTRHNRGIDACPQANSYRAEQVEGMVWSSISDYLKAPERVRTGLRRMLEEERKALRGDPEREAKVWFDKIAEVDRQRARAQDLAIEGLLSPDGLREKLTHLGEQRKTAERELETLRTQTERLANLELEADALLEQYARMTPEGLDRYTPEDRHQAYKALRLRVVVHPDGAIEADGIFNLNGAPLLCITEGAPGYSQSSTTAA